MQMSESAKKTRADYMREYMRLYRKKNPDKIKAIKAKYWEKKTMEAASNEHGSETN